MKHQGVWLLLLPAALLAAACDSSDAPKPPAATQAEAPATAAATINPPADPPAPLTPPPEPPEPPETLLDVIRIDRPTYPTTRPLPQPVLLADAERLVLLHPLHLCARGDLWLAHPQGVAPEIELPKAASRQVHLLRERPLAVHWSPDAAGAWQPEVLLATSAGVDWHHPTGRVSLPAVPEAAAWPLAAWPSAVSRGALLFVPTPGGVAVLQRTPAVSVTNIALIANARIPVFVATGDGLLAWVPWQQGDVPANLVRLRLHTPDLRRPTPAAAESFVVEPLTPEAGWPERVLHAVPMRDGSVVLLHQTAEGKARLHVVVPADPTLDRDALQRLVRQLSSREPEERQRAFERLSEYGPAAWPAMQELAARQPPEGRLRLETLLADAQRPRLGVVRPVGRSLQVVSRLRDGGVVLFADLVEVARSDGPPHTRANAYISVRPARPVQVLPEGLTAELHAGIAAGRDTHRLEAWQEEWLVLGGPAGPQRWLGNHFAPLLEDDELAFDTFVGIDARGRWLFADDDGRTLVLDPTLPDPTPRLPVWVWNPGGQAGRTNTGWPAMEAGDVFVLGEAGYRGLAKAKNAPGDLAAPAPGPAGGEDAGETFVDDPPDAGMGQAALAGWIPPAEHAGGGPGGGPGGGAARGPVVLESGGRLFVMTSPGKLLRMVRDDAGALEVEAVFTRGIPNTWPDAAWVDPAGRLIFRNGDRLHVAFPEGRIPQSIRVLMSLDELNAAEAREVRRGR
ncbi:MAG: hypothetical protein ACFCVE_02380 [Phycisphaerae bacterium]